MLHVVHDVSYVFGSDIIRGASVKQIVDDWTVGCTLFFFAGVIVPSSSHAV